MSHPIIEDLNKRYTVKQYDASKRISADDLATILEALRLSASSINSQPWKFVVVESDEAKQRLHDSFANKHQFNQHHAKEASHTILFAYDPKFTKEKFVKRVDVEVSSGHLPEDMRENFMGA
ncbi:MAG: nitroreductase family protein, partial [Pseudomonadota bacterium]|nr:nitroreductase family protein [Pseudomonadota bacterium]